jgi:hypothetical protein
MIYYTWCSSTEVEEIGTKGVTTTQPPQCAQSGNASWQDKPPHTDKRLRWCKTLLVRIFVSTQFGVPLDRERTTTRRHPRCRPSANLSDCLFAYCSPGLRCQAVLGTSAPLRLRLEAAYLERSVCVVLKAGPGARQEEREGDRGEWGFQWRGGKAGCGFELACV